MGLATVASLVVMGSIWTQRLMRPPKPQMVSVRLTGPAQAPQLAPVSRDPGAAGMDAAGAAALLPILGLKQAAPPAPPSMGSIVATWGATGMKTWSAGTFRRHCEALHTDYPRLAAIGVTVDELSKFVQFLVPRRSPEFERSAGVYVSGYEQHLAGEDPLVNVSDCATQLQLAHQGGAAMASSTATATAAAPSPAPPPGLPASAGVAAAR